MYRSVVGEMDEGPEAQRRRKIAAIVEEKMWPRLGRWKDFTWDSGLAPGHKGADKQTQTEEEPSREEGEDGVEPPNASAKGAYESGGAAGEGAGNKTMRSCPVGGAGSPALCRSWTRA